MNFLKNLFSPKAEPTRNVMPLKVRCRRCGEIIEAHIDLANELSADYDDAGRATYHCRKGLIGKQHCYQTIEVELQFDADRRLIDRTIRGGDFVDD